MSTVKEILDRLHDVGFTCYTVDEEWNFYRGPKQVRVLWNQASSVENTRKTVLDYFVNGQLIERFEAFPQTNNVGAEQFIRRVLH